MPKRANQASFLIRRWASYASTRSNWSIVAMLKETLTTTDLDTGKIWERSAGERQPSCRLYNLSKLDKIEMAIKMNEHQGKFPNNTFKS